MLEEFGDEAGPAGLMAGAQSGAVVAVEVFVKQNQVAPVRIVLKNFRSTGDGAAAVPISQKDMDQAARNLRSDLPEVGFAIRMRRTFHFEVFAIVVMKLLERLDKQIVHGKPNRAAPIGIAPEQASGGFRGFVSDAVDMVIDLHFVRVVLVEA